jgi:hypothetical protein
MRRSLVIALLFVCGCASLPDRQNVSDAKAGAQAIQQHPEATPSLKVTARGAEKHLEAYAVGKEMPAPQKSPEEIVGDPKSYEKQGEEAVEEAKSRSGGWLSWLWGGLCTIGVGLLPFLGPKGKAAQGILRLFPWFRRKEKDAEEAKTKANLGMETIVSCEFGRNQLKQLDDKLCTRGESGADVRKVIELLTDGRASTVEDLFVFGLETKQIDRGVQGPISALRKEVLDGVETRYGRVW